MRISHRKQQIPRVARDDNPTTFSCAKRGGGGGGGGWSEGAAERPPSGGRCAPMFFGGVEPPPLGEVGLVRLKACPDETALKWWLRLRPSVGACAVGCDVLPRRFLA